MSESLQNQAPLQSQQLVPPVSTSGLLLPTFVFTTLLSSTLLFLVQPLMARLTLPLLGGSPSVWAVSMCFFQAMLLCGYAYAHALNRFVPMRMGMIVHVLLMLMALQLLPVQVTAETAARFAGMPEAQALLLVLLTCMGLPFAVMSANAPLIQSWFSQSGHKDASQPYFLYGASNLGSMAALLLYPTVIEPLVGLRDQTQLWAGGFAFLTASLFACAGLIALRHRAAPAQTHEAQEKAGAQVFAPVAWKQRGYWLLMAFTPSALLVAWTNHITTDVAAAPFLWLPPLALFLVSFTATFTERPWFSDRALRITQLLSVPLSFALLQGVNTWLMLPLIVLGAVSFFSTACICHRQMYVARPDARHLTEFYLIMSLGGVLGGLFVSLLAPVLFNDVAEYPALLLLGVLLPRSVLANARVHAELLRAFVYLLTFVGLVFAAETAGLVFQRPGLAGLHALLIATSGVGALLFARAEEKPLMGLFIFLFIVQIGASAEKLVFQQRNFFGVLSVRQTDDYALMYHGTTVHGAIMRKDLETGAKPHPLTYYAPRGGMAKAIAATQQRLQAQGRPGTYGVVGLGAGSLACYAAPGETWKFYEINADVVEAARNPKLFTFLSSCTPQAPVILGDARLTLQQQPDHSMDLLVVDAFTSDSVPVHLLTTEALQGYFRLLKEDGLLVLHASNRHMDLISVLGANVEALKQQGLTLSARQITHIPLVQDYADTASQVVVLSREPASFGSLEEDPEIRDLPQSAGVAPWTDDYSNILGAIWRGITEDK